MRCARPALRSPPDLREVQIPPAPSEIHLDAPPGALQTPVMAVILLAERFLRAPIDAVFALSVDPVRFPPTFVGCGPVPALTSIAPDAPSAVGSTRQLVSADGSRLTERITVWDPPQRHSYVLSGFQMPMSLLVRAGHADWHLEARDDGTQVRWTYTFELTSPLAWPLAAPLLQGFMRAAMNRCLERFARTLENAPENIPDTAPGAPR
jgi:hypothetical protein